MRNQLLRSTTRGCGAALAATAMLLAGGSAAEAAGGSSTEPISLPDSLNGLENPLVADQLHHIKASGLASQRRVYADAKRLTTAAYSRAYDGAATAVAFYTNAEQTQQVNVIAVRAPSPGLTIGVVDNPSDVGLALNERQVQTFGDVACVVQDEKVVAAGHHANPSSLYYSQCQRAGSDLTVSVFTNLHGVAGRRKAVAFTNSAYRAVAGG